MTIQRALLQAITKLRKLKRAAAMLDAEVLLAFALRKTRAFLLAHPEKKLPKAAVERFNRIVTQRLRGYPIAYLTGAIEFYSLSFTVNRHVLIPRPETELLIDETLQAARRRVQNVQPKTVSIAEIGTGSGCIAITLARYLPKAKIIATDISAAALAVAKKNATRHGVSKQITFRRGNLAKPLKNETFEIVVANLPYGTPREAANVLFEPNRAINGGTNGLVHISKLLRDLPKILEPHGMALLEIDPRRAHRVVSLAKQYLPESDVRVIKDLHGWDRVVKISVR